VMCKGSVRTIRARLSAAIQPAVPPPTITTEEMGFAMIFLLIRSKTAIY